MNKSIQRFKGYLNTPLLWGSEPVKNLDQLQLPLTSAGFSGLIIPEKIRLGKLVELFVYFQLKQITTIDILVQNLQVIQDKITIGELDCVFRDLELYIHLEIVYKFYLYDESLGPLEIDRWIGPNRKDSLSKKVNKLSQKQLPLIAHFRTKELLYDLGVDVHALKQKVFFKAQLYTPIHLTNHTFKSINNNCIMGYYIGMTEYRSMQDCYFYMPKKLDWLIVPHLNVEWKDHAVFTEHVEKEINEKRSPLCWVKTPYGILQKIFVVFWENQ